MDQRIIRDTASFAEEYDTLDSNDIIVGRIRIKPGEEHVLLDLAARQVTLIPSAVSQLSSRSKVFQTRLLRQFMIPGTVAVYDRHDVIDLVGNYNRKGIGKVVCKLDRANAGQGILLFNSVEDIYNNTVLGVLQFPVVVQPFIENVTDVRAVIVGETVEAYTRHNPDNFRHNLHCGGKSAPHNLTEAQLELCHRVMERADFPYAHVDLLVDRDGNTWLSEINLRGGLRGAKLSQEEYLAAVDKINSELLERFVG